MYLISKVLSLLEILGFTYGVKNIVPFSMSFFWTKCARNVEIEQHFYHSEAFNVSLEKIRDSQMQNVRNVITLYLSMKIIE